MERRTKDTPVAHLVEREAGTWFAEGGQEYTEKIDAMEAAARAGYQYATGSGTYWGDEIKAIPKRIRDRARLDEDRERLKRGGPRGGGRRPIDAERMIQKTIGFPARVLEEIPGNLSEFVRTATEKEIQRLKTKHQKT